MSPEQARLFVALDLPPALRRVLATWAARGVGGDDRFRLVAVDNLHVTLCFLGWRGDDEVAAIRRCVEACAQPVPEFELELAAPVWLPAARPRVLAVEVADPARGLAAAQQRLSRALEESAGHRPEKRGFRPHVTVARVRSGARPRLRRGIELPPPPCAGFAAEAVTLYRSHPGAGGARYEALLRVAPR